MSGFVRVRGETDASLLKFAAVGDDGLGFGRAALRAMLLYRLDDVDALHDFAEHDVLPVQPGEEKEDLLYQTSRVCVSLSLYIFFLIDPKMRNAFIVMEHSYLEVFSALRKLKLQ